MQPINYLTGTFAAGVLTDSWPYYYCSQSAAICPASCILHPASDIGILQSASLAHCVIYIFNMDCFHYAFFTILLLALVLLPGAGAFGAVSNCNFCCLKIYDHQWAPEAAVQ